MPRRRPDEHSLVNAKDLAERWGIHPDTVRRIPASKLPYIRISARRRKYRWGDVVAYEERNIVRE
jgi:hypothetical protein